MVGNLVLRRRASGAVKRDFRTYIRQYNSPYESFEYGYPHSYVLLQFCLKFDHCKLHKAARHLTNREVVNDVNHFQQYSGTTSFRPPKKYFVSFYLLSSPFVLVIALYYLSVQEKQI